MPKGSYNEYSSSGARKKSSSHSLPEQGKIAGDKAITTWPTGKKQDPHSKFGETASHTEGIGTTQAKKDGSGKVPKYDRMV